MNPAIEKLARDMREKFGDDAAFSAAEYPSIGRIPTGSYMLDAALGGGWALDRINEIYGLEHGGKTAMVLLAIAGQQAAGGAAFYINSEGTWDKKFATMLGVNADDLLISMPTVAEDAMSMAEKAIKSKQFTLVAIDSITAMIPSHVEEKEYDPTMGVEAKLNNLFLRRLIPAMKRDRKRKGENHCAVLIVNQPRFKLGGGSPMPLPPEPGGGQGLKHGKSISLQVGKGMWLGTDGHEFKQKGNKAGFEVRFQVKKNKTAAPYREGSFRFFFKKWDGGAGGIDLEHDIARLRKMHNIPKTKKVTGPELAAMPWPEGW